MDKISFFVNLKLTLSFLTCREWRGIPVALKKLKDHAMRSDQISMFIGEIDLMR